MNLHGWSSIHLNSGADQLDGAAEDQKRDEVDKKPDLPPPGQIVTKPKEEDVKIEDLPIPPTGPILLHSTLGHSQASPGSSRGPAPARTPSLDGGRHIPFHCRPSCALFRLWEFLW